MGRKGVNLKFIGGLLCLFLFLLHSIAFAEVKEITAEGKYNMGDGETPIVAKSRAILQAKRNAVEQAGTYVESYSKVKNFHVMEDEIHVLASAVTGHITLEEKWTIIGDAFNYWVKIKAWVSTDKMEEMAKRIKEKTVLEDYKRIQEAYDKSQKEIQALKKELAEAKSPQGKNEIKAKIAENERLFQANEWFDKGFHYVMNKEYDKAIEALSFAISLNSNDFRFYGVRGVTYGFKGQYDRAIEDHSKAISLNPNLAAAYGARGIAYDAKRQYDRAIEDYNKAISIEPNSASAYSGRGNAYVAKGQLDRAIEDFNKAIAINPDYALSAEIYSNRGFAYDNKGQYDRAIEDYNKAISLDPNIAVAYLNRGRAYAAKGLLDKAIEDFNKGIAINPNYAEAYYNRGLVYANKRQYDRAIEDNNKAIAINPNLDQAYLNRGFANYMKKEYDRAIEDFSKAISINPNLAQAYSNLGAVYLDLNDNEKALYNIIEAARLGHKKAQEVLEEFEKQQTKNNEGNNLRIFQPGDYINYKVTGFVNEGGGDLAIFGTAQFRVTDETQVDYYGKRCQVFRMTMAFNVMGKDQTGGVKRTIDQFITQDVNGSLMIHGARDNEKKTTSFVRTPWSGWYYAFKCPFNLHESVLQNVFFTDGSSINGTDMILNQEQVFVPAGIFSAVKAIANTLTTNADSSKRQNIETTWLTPEIGPIRSNSESFTEKHSMKIILEMTETNIPYKGKGVEGEKRELEAAKAGKAEQNQYKGHNGFWLRMGLGKEISSPPPPAQANIVPQPPSPPSTSKAQEAGRDGRFIAYDNGAVIDTKTGLMWAAKDNGSDIKWPDAKRYCENYRGGGYSDWRMPTLNELASLYESSKSRLPSCSYFFKIHVATELIDITCFAHWAWETSQSEVADFSFRSGDRNWGNPSLSGRTRALPVRSVK